MLSYSVSKKQTPFMTSLCETFNIGKTDIIHFALKQLEERFNTQTVSP